METKSAQPAQKYVLAIDSGTGGPKVGLVDLDGNVVGSASGVTPIYFLPNNGAEQDPEEWWSAIVTASRQAIQNARVDKEDIVAISVTGQWGVIVPVDEHGEPLMRAMSWADMRGEPYNKQIVQGFPMVQGFALPKLLKWMDITGMPPMLTGSDSLGHMLFIKHALPEIYRKTYKFLEPMDYINLRLTGKCVASMCTILSSNLTDNRNLESKEYHPWLLKVSGLDKEKMPEIVPVDSVIGKVTPSIARELGVSEKTVVVAASSDNSTSAVGSGAVVEGSVAAVLGTSGYLSAHIRKKKSDLTHFIVSVASARPGWYLTIAETGNTCKVLDSFLRNVVYNKDVDESGPLASEIYPQVNEIAGQVEPGAGGVIFMPWFLGAMAPQGDTRVHGGFVNMTNRTTQAELTRAVLEGIAFNWRWLREPYEKFIGTKPAYWRLTGGGSLLDIWAQIMADVVGIPMHQQADPRNSNVLGAAFLGFQRLGLMDWEDIPQKVKFAKVYEPRPENKEIYDRLFAQFQASFKGLRSVYHALHE